MCFLYRWILGLESASSSISSNTTNLETRMPRGCFLMTNKMEPVDLILACSCPKGGLLMPLFSPPAPCQLLGGPMSGRKLGFIFFTCECV